MLGLLSTEEAHAHPAMAHANSMDMNFLSGSGPEVADQLEKLAVEFTAAEVVMTVSAVEVADRIDSIERIAASWS